MERALHKSLKSYRAWTFLSLEIRTYSEFFNIYEIVQKYSYNESTYIYTRIWPQPIDLHRKPTKEYFLKDCLPYRAEQASGEAHHPQLQNGNAYNPFHTYSIYFNIQDSSLSLIGHHPKELSVTYHHGHPSISPAESGNTPPFTSAQPSESLTHHSPTTPALSLSPGEYLIKLQRKPHILVSFSKLLFPFFQYGENRAGDGALHCLITPDKYM